MSEKEGFAERWSRRKAEARRNGSAPSAPQRDEAQAAAAPVEPAPPEDRRHGLPADETASAAAAPEGEAPFDPATLPPVESLTAASDYRDFLRTEVPRQLRRKALRHLWRSDPVFANLDGLLEYGEDYSKLGMVETGVTSAWQAGRGFAGQVLDTLTQAAPGDTGDRTSPTPEPPAAPPQVPLETAEPMKRMDFSTPTEADDETSVAAGEGGAERAGGS